jgi:hypothetical protein
MQYQSGGPWLWSSEAPTAYPRSARAGLCLLRSTATEWPFHADAMAQPARGALIVRHPLPESADTGRPGWTAEATSWIRKGL